MSLVDLSAERVEELERMMRNEIPMRTEQDRRDIECLQIDQDERSYQYLKYNKYI